MENKDFTLAEQFSRITQLLLRERLRDFKPCEGPDAWRKRLLGLIRMHPGITAKDLIRLLNRRMPAGEELLLGLEKKGYITMTPVNDSDDKTVELTASGLKEAAEYQDLNNMFDVLSDEEKTALNGYLARIISDIEKNAGADEAYGFSQEEDWFADIRDLGSLAGLDRMRKLHEYFSPRRGTCGHFPGSPY